MPVLTLNRDQTWLFPPSLDELVPKDHPARFVAALVDGLDRKAWAEMEIVPEGDPLGTPAYNPRALLAVWVYGFMTATRSSRKLEAACRDQIPYLWLTGWQHPDHNTLWRFYKAHRPFLKKLFKRSVRAAVRMGLVDLAMQAVDGTKISGNASKFRTHDKAQLEKLLEKTEAAIKDLEAQNEAGLGPAAVHLPKELEDKQRLLAQVKQAMESLDVEDGKKRINLTDGDTGFLKTRSNQVIAGYNMEAMVSKAKAPENALSTDASSGKAEPEKTFTGRIITAIDVTPDQNDNGQLIPMMEQSQENTGRPADVSLADAGFHSGSNLRDAARRPEVMVMSEPHEKDLAKPYHKDHFLYHAGSDSFTCPEGQTLKFSRPTFYRNTPVREYSAAGAVCRRCRAYGSCTVNSKGRRLQIGPYEPFIRSHREWMATPEAKDLYKRRKELPEPVFGIFKEQMAGRRFLLRGLPNVRAEATLLATAFNLRTIYSAWRKGVGSVVQWVQATMTQAGGNTQSPGVRPPVKHNIWDQGACQACLQRSS